MSGIVGLFDRTGGAVGPEDVTAMHERIAHRGPDGGDIWRDGRAGLGHQLLATTPEAADGDQPVRDGDLVVVADARLDNRGELLETLPARPSTRPVTDAELLLESYRRWGPDCVEHLVGAFAVAVWDAAEERLFCARDHTGVKPFYYHRSDDLFAFGSELKAPLALPTVSRSVDETKIGDFLLNLHEDETNTFYRSIRRLPPAHAMAIDRDGSRRWQYWDLDPSRTIELASDAAYERRFRELFERAVRCRLRTDGTVGSELSGGMDSSSVTAVSRSLLPETEPLHAFSLVSDDAPSSDEREFIETLTGRPGISAHYCFLDDVGAFPDGERALSYFDKPPHNTLHFGEWEVAKRAGEVGVDVALSGAFGDGAVGYGLGLLPYLFRTGRWRHLCRELRSMGAVVGAPAREQFYLHVLSPMIPGAVTRRYRRLRGRSTGANAANPALDPTFVDRFDLERRYADRFPMGRPFESPRERQYRTVRSGYSTVNFETANLVYTAFGIEPRYPFTDIRLLEFTLAMPPTQQLKDGYTRSIVRRSLDDLLPEKIRWRPWKTPVTEMFWNALSREDDRLSALVDDPGHLAEYVDPAELEGCYDRFTDEPTSRDARVLWRTLSLSKWLEAPDSGAPARHIAAGSTKIT